MSIALSDLRRVPYLRLDSLGDRIPVLLPVWDGSKWSMWIVAEGNLLIEVHPLDAARGEYLAKEEARASDLFFPFLNFMWQRASWAEVIPSVKAIADDLQNLASAFGKLEFFWRHRRELTHCLEAFATTDVEYVFTVARGILDHLQEIISTMWKRTRSLESPQTPLKKLPDSMHEMVYDKKLDRSRTPDELAHNFLLPPALVNFYIMITPFVLEFGKLRNAIIHRGQKGGPIFITERGYAIPVRERLYNAVPDIWKPEHHFNDALVSLKPLLSHLVLGSLDACSAAMEAYSDRIVFSPELMPGYRVFTRIHQARALLRAQGVLKNGSPWWDLPEDRFEEEPLPSLTRH